MTDRDSEHGHPSTNQPLHGKRRPLAGPLLGVVGLVVVVVGIVAVLTVLRYAT